MQEGQQTARASTYPALEGLSDKQLAYRVPTEGPAVWACVSRDEILQRLDAAERERLRQHRARSERLHSLLDQHIPHNPPWCARRCGCCTPPRNNTTFTAALPAKSNTKPCSPPPSPTGHRTKTATATRC
jgi:hypothetical protein